MTRVALALSLTLHALALGAMWFALPPDALTSRAVPSPVLAMDLVAPRPIAAKAPRAAPASAPAAVAQAAPVTAPESAVVVEVTTAPTPTPVAPAASPGSQEASARPTELSSTCWQDVHAQLLARLDTALPRAVRQRGLTGQVRVRFSLAPGGVVRQVVLEESSGHALLDDAVRELLRAPLATDCTGEGRWPLVFRRGAPRSL